MTVISDDAEHDWPTVKGELLERSLKRGAVVARVGDPALLDCAAPGQRPVDLLPQVKSMIVLGGSAPRVGEWNSPRAEVLETVGTADRMAGFGSALAREIEERLGYYALNVPTSTDHDDQAFLDFAAAAVAAGAATPSLAGPVLHPDHGLVHLTVILTSLPHDEFPIEEYEASARFKDTAAASYRQGGVKNLYKGNPPSTRA